MIISTVLALASQLKVQAGCYKTTAYICHAKETGTNCGYPWYTTSGSVDRARGLTEGEGSGQDDNGYVDTTCDWVIHYYDCGGFGHTQNHSDPVQGSYARGGDCSK
jgi:hypothetical protein